MQENKPEYTQKAPASPVVPKLKNIPERVEYPLDLDTIGRGFIERHDDCDADDEAENSNIGDRTMLVTQPPSPEMPHTTHENEYHSGLYYALLGAGKIDPH